MAAVASDSSPQGEGLGVIVPSLACVCVRSCVCVRVSIGAGPHVGGDVCGCVFAHLHNTLLFPLCIN